MSDREAFFRERHAVLTNPTIEAATAFWDFDRLGPPSHPNVPLAAIHRTRCAWPDATGAMIADSVAWLKSHGYSVPDTMHTRDLRR